MTNTFLNICTSNCAGLRDKNKLHSILRLIEEKKVDIALLQETHLVKNDRNYIEKIWKGTVHLSGSSTNSKGLITLFSKSLAPESIEILHTDDRTIVSACKLDKEIKTIITNVYAPNNNRDKNQYFIHLINILKDILRNRNEYSLLCAGDYNTVKDNEIDIISGLQHCNDTVKNFNTFINELMLNDAWRCCNRNERMHSWRRGNIARRLDYILIDDILNTNLESSKIEPIGFSDHLLVSIKLKLSNFKYGKSYYKMNTSILLNKDYVKIMKKEIPNINRLTRYLSFNYFENYEK